MTKPLNPWWPMTSQIDRALFGKALEEAGELTSALARCTIQGIHEEEPVTGKPNLEWLLDEMADMQALLVLLEERVGSTDLDRVTAKVIHLRQWFAMVAVREHEERFK